MKIAFVLGTRPEIIKLFPVIRAHIRRDIPFTVIHTNQHYSSEMDAVFFQQLHLPPADYNLGVGSGTHGKQIGQMCERLESVLGELKPAVVYVQGDTNSVLAGALIASRLGIPVAHVEAGLRSYDRRMPEEFNRIFADHLSEYLLAPTEKAKQILLGEGFPESKVYLTGNTIVDAVNEVSRLAAEQQPVEQRWGVGKAGYILITLHRPENVDHGLVLKPIIEAIDELSIKFGLPAVFPVHPRTAKRLQEFGLSLPESFIRLEAVDYLSFVQLEKEARLVITDSGGVQEEACILGVPCVTVRLKTERPETVEVGANLVTGVEREAIVAGAKEMIDKPGGWPNPFGDGKAGERIVDIVMERQTGGFHLP